MTRASNRATSWSTSAPEPATSPRTCAAAARGCVAIELDAAFADALRRRFADDAGITVVEGDARTAPLPAEPFRVVANLPFAGSGAILDRLLDASQAMERADVVLEWAMAQKRSEIWPATSRAVIAAATFRVTIARRLPAACFDPPPRVDAAVLVAERRQIPLVAGGRPPGVRAVRPRGLRRTATCSRPGCRGLAATTAAPGRPAGLPARRRRPPARPPPVGLPVPRSSATGFARRMTSSTADALPLTYFRRTISAGVGAGCREAQGYGTCSLPRIVSPLEGTP